MHPHIDTITLAVTNLDRSLAFGHGFSLGHTVSSRAEVDELLDAARVAGGAIVGTVGERPWGSYSGYFTDPDGHLWEVVHFSDGS